MMPDTPSFVLPIPSRSRAELDAAIEQTLAAPVHDNSDVWPITFLREYRDTGSQSPRLLELAIRCCDQVTDLQLLLFAALVEHFNRDNHTAIRGLVDLTREVELLVVHMSCEARLERALKSAQTFSEAGVPVRNVAVIGRESAVGYQFDPDRRILTVPTPDNYEGLSRKMAATYRFLSF